MLFIIVFILLLQILGLDLTALTVFGGAVGVGLGFGLQQIASNFISGIIILLERSIGDILVALWIALDLTAHLIGEILWFQEVDYLRVFLKRFQTELGLWIIGFGITISFLLGNLHLAQRLKWPVIPQESNIINPNVGTAFSYSQSTITSNQSPIPQTPVLRLRTLLPTVVGLSLVMGLRLLHYIQVAIEVRDYDFNLPNVTPPLPPPFRITSFTEILAQITQNIWNFEYLWKLGMGLFLLIILLVKLPILLKILAYLMSFVFGIILSGNWTRVLQYFRPTNFNKLEPLLHTEISFNVFRLPTLQLLDFWLEGLLFHGLIAATLVYLLSGNSLSEGKFPGFSSAQLRHLYALTGLLMFALAFRHWLNRYGLLYSLRGVTYGASYTDVNIQLPLEIILTIVALVIAMWLIFQAWIGFKPTQKLRYNSPEKKQKYISAVGLICVYIAILFGGFILAAAVQRLNVQPNELARETDYIKRSIEYTRAGFALDKIESKTFDPEGKLTSVDIENNYLTIDNIRLWDSRTILQTNRQLQQLRLYYRFPDADIDRYHLKIESKKDEIIIPNSQSLRTKEKRQVIIAARELDYNDVPKRAKTWVNQHLVYTHGYGFTLSPVHHVDDAGLPYYYVKDIGTAAELDQENSLYTSSPLIQESIPIGKPRIYYGELTNTYIITPTNVDEFDFPRGEENVYNTYDGTGGISISSLKRRLLFAQYLKDWRMLFARNFKENTRLLFRRNINHRVRAIAPFLHYDHNPYLVVADAENKDESKLKNNLYWIMDAYTTSDHYPYSDPGNKKYNYIRNSVKVVINAYNGNADFYVADPDDPIIKTWTKIFPDLFKPFKSMPKNLRLHIRYPEDLFSVQSERLLTYHMIEPQVFYNKEDQWEIPQEIYGNKLQPVAPYYLVMKFPEEQKEEFILLLPYTPTSRPNLIAWLAGRCDGEQYGKLLLYQFPKQKLIYGPDQIEALINQDPIISQQISLWSTKGSQVIQGNLLVIPIEQSLLYVEPLYLEAEQNSLPTLARVIVVYENRIIMAETMKKALQAIFEPEKPSTPTIIRPLDLLIP
ncbi:MAG: COG1615 family transporter [Moorea sp. SIO2B7]|nr:COG1615 family transporter [Moorena sp. SIO2B7]